MLRPSISSNSEEPIDELLQFVGSPRVKGVCVIVVLVAFGWSLLYSLCHSSFMRGESASTCGGGAGCVFLLGGGAFFGPLGQGW